MTSSKAAAAKPLVIFGAGTLARLAYSYFKRDTGYDIAACTVHEEHLGSAQLHGLPVVPFEGLRAHYPPTEYAVFVAVGYTRVNRSRAEVFDRCTELGYDLPSLVSSSALSWDDLRIGRNCLLFDGVVVEPNVDIADDVIVWSGSQVSHDATIGNHCFLGPNAVLLGNVTVGERTFIGGNATIRNGITIAADCVVGAGVVIKADTKQGEIYASERAHPVEGRHSRDVVEL